MQMADEKKPKRIPLGEAVAQKIIANETLAYFIGRTYLFAERVSWRAGGGRGGRAPRELEMRCTAAAGCSSRRCTSYHSIITS